MLYVFYLSIAFSYKLFWVLYYILDCFLAVCSSCLGTKGPIVLLVKGLLRNSFSVSFFFLLESYDVLVYLLLRLFDFFIQTWLLAMLNTVDFKIYDGSVT